METAKTAQRVSEHAINVEKSATSAKFVDEVSQPVAPIANLEEHRTHHGLTH
jgi:hypothetical protein